ncbi:unnamed protein product [Protopolystoma xenopodis]|uniref:Uncharacterized protein n=1 Tax=Protopolystoma xenopodis TaxID=117903 RepID=A0A448X023_9PLAT|nr:unnamed protein product [Protopolystoma xenopodis]
MGHSPTRPFGWFGQTISPLQQGQPIGICAALRRQVQFALSASFSKSCSSVADCWLTDLSCPSLLESWSPPKTAGQG